MDGWIDFVPILLNFVPCRGRCHATILNFRESLFRCLQVTLFRSLLLLSTFRLSLIDHHDKSFLMFLIFFSPLTLSPIPCPLYHPLPPFHTSPISFLFHPFSKSQSLHYPIPSYCKSPISSLHAHSFLVPLTKILELYCWG